jgi:hypothetical protein
MPTPDRLMAAGLAGGLAAQLGMTTATGLVAAGTTQGNALDISATDINMFATVAAGTGARLASAEGQPLQAVFNGGANALLIYPFGTEFINALGASTAISLPAGKAVTFYPGRLSWVANVSA